MIHGHGVTRVTINVSVCSIHQLYKLYREFNVVAPDERVDLDALAALDHLVDALDKADCAFFVAARLDAFGETLVGVRGAARGLVEVALFIHLSPVARVVRVGTPFTQRRGLIRIQTAHRQSRVVGPVVVDIFWIEPKRLVDDRVEDDADGFPAFVRRRVLLLLLEDDIVLSLWLHRELGYAHTVRPWAFDPLWSTVVFQSHGSHDVACHTFEYIYSHDHGDGCVE